jgi:3-isopropylmalate dehydrogenase
MAKRTVVSMPGDGIGKTVLPEATRVLDAVGFEADYVHADVGWEFWINEGNALPERTVELLAQHKLGLFGAITSKPKPQAAAELKPELRDKGYVYFSPIVAMRQRFHLDVCIRPCRSFPGNPLNFIRRTADGGFEEPKVDAVIFRQNTEGMYAGIEWTDPPQQVREALATHTKFKAFAATPSSDLAVSTRVFTRRGCRRIVTAAFEYARKHGYKSVTVCEKPNVLRETSGMMEEVAREVHADYSNIQLRLRRLRRFGRRAGLRRLGEHRRGGCRLRADPRLGAEVRRARSADRQPHRHDPDLGDDAGPRRRDRQGQSRARCRGRGRARGPGARL